MTVDVEKEGEIRRLFYGEHLPLHTVATSLNVHEDVVKRVLGLLQPREYHKQRALLIDPYRDFITETLANYPRLRATRLFDMMQSRGFNGSERTVRKYVQDVRPRPPREAYLRLTPLVAEQAQIDWAHVGKVEVVGGSRSLWLFVMSLPWSRAAWGEFVFDLSVWSLLRSLQRGFAAFGGTAREWLFDNAKTVVIARHGNVVRFHDLLLALAGQYAVKLRVCQVRKANQKGNVERHIRYLRDRFLAARVIRTIEQGNNELAEFNDAIANKRPHPTLPGRTVGECFEEERTRLLPLPRQDVSTDQVAGVRVDKTAFCRFDTNIYSVGPAHAGKTITLAADDREVRLLEGTSILWRHTRCWGRRQVIEAKEHRQELLDHKAAAKPQKGRDRLLAAVPAIEKLYESWVERGRNLGSMTARTLKLLDLYGAAMLEAAVAQVLARGLHDPGAIASLCEQQRLVQSAPVPLDVHLAAHVRDRDVIPHALEGYDVK
jgi:transposase